MTFTKTAGAMATPVQVWEGASEPEIKFWDAIMSSPWCKIISKSPVISVASSAQGVEMIFEKHLQIVQITESN